MRDLVDFIDNEEVFPSHAQTIRMRALSKDGKLDREAIDTIMNEEKPNQKARIAVVIGALLLGGLYFIFNDMILPGLAERIQDMFGSPGAGGNNGGGGGIIFL